MVKGREDEEERKGGAPPWIFGGGRSGGLLQRLGFGGRGVGAGGHLAGAGAGAGKMGLARSVVAFLGSNAGKALTVAMICGSSVFSLYSVQMSAVKAKPSVSKRGVFNDPSQALARRQAEMNSLAAVSGANKGFFGSEQAAADASAAQQAADAAAAEAVVDAPQTAALPIPGGIPDPNQIAAQAAQQLLKGKPGAGASSAAGGGGGGSSLAGGPNLSGALASMKGADSKTLPTKNLQAMRGGVQTRAASLRGTGPTRGRGAMSQLKHASRESRKGAASKGPEGQAYNAENAFSPAGASGGGSSLGGAGVQSGGGGTTAGISDSGDGGPISQPDPGTGEQKAPDSGSGTNQTPYQKELTMAVSLLMVASTIIMIVGMLSLAGNTPFTAFLKGIAKMLYIAAIAMAAMATLIGAMIMSKHGQQSQGMILTIGGGITTVAAGVAWAVGTTTGSWIAVLGGIAGLATSVGSLLAPSKVPATAPGADSKTSAASGTTAGK
ncbi:MAG: hypothetical protein AAB576_07370 [Elusimicrobiota bacterium]